MRQASLEGPKAGKRRQAVVNVQKPGRGNVK